MHGGKRTPGPGKKLGRPVMDEIDKKQPYGTKLDRLVVLYLKECKNGAGTIETTIKRSKAFREWLKTKLQQHREKDRNDENN